MRKNRQDAAESRERVVQTASELFRDHGYDGIGIATLMQAAGLTNGAFYKQFASKEALIAEATAHALAGNADAWDAALAQAGKDPIAALERWYLTDTHLHGRDSGCTYAALAAEAPRHEAPVREAFETGLRKTLAQIAEALGNGPDAEVQAIRLLSRLVGALALARAVAEPALADRILAANRPPDDAD